MDCKNHVIYEKFYLCNDEKETKRHYHCFNCLKIVKNRGSHKLHFKMAIIYIPNKLCEEIQVWVREKN